MPHATCRDDVIVNYFQILRQRPKQLALLLLVLLLLRKRKQRQDSPQHGKHNTTQAWQTHTRINLHTHTHTLAHTHSHTCCAGLTDCTLLLSVLNIFIHLFALFSHSGRIYRSPPHRSPPTFAGSCRIKASRQKQQQQQQEPGRIQIPKIEGNGQKRKIAKRNWKTHAKLTRSNQADNRNKFEYIYMRK